MVWSMSRGQFIIEFMILLAVAVLVGLIYLASATSLFTDVSEQQRIAALNDIGYMVQDEVLLAETVDDGYSRSFVLPSSADRFPYSLRNDVDNGVTLGITLTSGSVSITYPLPPVSGNFTSGAKNLVSKDGGIMVELG